MEDLTAQQPLAEIGIGMLGYGMIGRVHSMAYGQLRFMYPGQLPPVQLAAVCASRRETAFAAAQEAGFKTWCLTTEELLEREDVTVVDVVTPNDLHHEMVLAAIAAGKHVYCEKPLALNAQEARAMYAAARRADVRVGMTFNYRFVPAILRARQIMEEGLLGEVYAFRAEYLHAGYQDPTRPLSWRMQRERAGGGALVDLGSHAIDLVRYLMGEFAAVQCTTRTYIPERPVRAGAAEKGPVTVDDAAWVQARLQSGAIGTIEATRFATGTVDDLSIAIYGQRGSLRWNLMDPNWLYWYDARRPGEPIAGERGWTRVETVQRFPGSVAPPARTPMGWLRTHAENQYAFLRAVVAGEPPRPDILDGLRTQLVIEAAYQAAESGGWASVELE
ncbi:MAG: Gfo/Idh/MocA family protein [Anaerolineae bacterium]